MGFSRSLQLQMSGRSCKSFCMSVSGPFAHSWLVPGTFNSLTLTSAVRGRQHASPFFADLETEVQEINILSEVLGELSIVGSEFKSDYSASAFCFPVKTLRLSEDSPV